MKILCVLSSVSPFGGSSKSFLRLVKELSCYSIDIQIVVPLWGGMRRLKIVE